MRRGGWRKGKGKEDGAYLGLEGEQGQSDEDTEGDKPIELIINISYAFLAVGSRRFAELFTRLRAWCTYNACNTIKLLKKATITPRVKASMSVNVDRRTRLRGWLWRFQ